MSSLVEYTKRSNLQLNNTAEMDVLTSKLLLKSGNIIEEILLADTETSTVSKGMQLKAIDSLLKMRKQIKDEEQAAIKFILENGSDKDKEGGVDWGDVENED